MTRNQKIALGCGGGGCLGLIVLIIFLAVLSTFGYLSLPWSSTNRNYNFNVNNSNRNSNFNSNYNSNSNRNSNSNFNTNSSSSSSSMSSDDKHRLYQAAGMTQDQALMLRVFNKIGLGSSGTDHEEFVKEHFTWAMNNLDFIQSVNTPEKARAYVEEHIDD